MITGDEFLSCANRWALLSDGSGGGEAVWRTAIGRSYYGAFHLSLSLLRDNLGIPFPSGRSKRNEHELVQQALKHSEVPSAIKAAGLLGDLHQYRKNADYRIGVTEHGKQQLAQHCVLIAHEIQSILTSYDESQLDEMKHPITAFIKLQHGLR